MVRTKEEKHKGYHQLGSLSGLPDFKTEEATVRNQLVAWQASWLKTSTTAKVIQSMVSVSIQSNTLMIPHGNFQK